MSDDVTRAWTEVGQRFSAFGRTVRDHYRSGPKSDEAREASNAIEDALNRLSQAIQDFTDHTTEVVKDTDVRASTKDLGRCLEQAMGATVDFVGHEVDDVVKRVSHRKHP